MSQNDHHNHDFSGQQPQGYPPPPPGFQPQSMQQPGMFDPNIQYPPSQPHPHDAYGNNWRTQEFYPPPPQMVKRNAEPSSADRRVRIK